MVQFLFAFYMGTKYLVSLFQKQTIRKRHTVKVRVLGRCVSGRPYPGVTTYVPLNSYRIPQTLKHSNVPDLPKFPKGLKANLDVILKLRDSYQASHGIQSKRFLLVYTCAIACACGSISWGRHVLSTRKTLCLPS